MFDYITHGPPVGGSGVPATAIDLVTGEIYVCGPSTNGWQHVVSRTGGRPGVLVPGDTPQTGLVRDLQESDLTASIRYVRNFVDHSRTSTEPTNVTLGIAMYIPKMALGKTSIGLYVESHSRINKFDDNTVQGAAVKTPHQWGAATAYVIGDIVGYNGVDYQALAGSTGVDPEQDSGVTIATGHSFEGAHWKRLTTGQSILAMGGLVRLEGALLFPAFCTAKNALAGTDVLVSDLPAKPAGYLNVLVNGIPARLPYYASPAGQPPADDLCCDCDCCDPQPPFPGSQPIGTEGGIRLRDSAASGFKG